MTYDTELNFFKKMVFNFNLDCKVVEEPFDAASATDKGLRQLLYQDFNYEKIVAEFSHTYEPRTIYRIHDRFYCHYFLLRLPDTKVLTYLILGPYLTEDITEAAILTMIDRFSLAPGLLPQLEKYYQDIPLISDGAIPLILVTTLAEQLWGDMDSFTMQDTQDLVNMDIEPVTSRPEGTEIEDTALAMRVLEKRYAAENQLMQAVAAGQLHRAEAFVSGPPFSWMENRAANPLRNAKNYTIILNTLLRKAAEAGAVHPLHIDSLSTRFARKIELAVSTKALSELHREMVHKYCILVKNHSIKGYSLLVQKTLTRIESDLTADLSLKSMAALLNVNSSYLSMLFKKETGSTLTDYVNHKRIEHAIFLLNSTSMQVQAVARLCGIPDVNYFTKLFRKLVGKTPTEYRGEIF